MVSLIFQPLSPVSPFPIIITGISQIRPKFTQNLQILYPPNNIDLLARETKLNHIYKISQDNIDKRTYYPIQMVLVYKWS